MAPLALIGGWTVAAALQPGFDANRETISALQAVGAPDRWLMNLSFLLTGACHITTATALRTAALPGRVILALGGLATMALVAAPLPSTTGSSTAHGAAAGIAFIALAIWAAFAVDATGRIRALQRRFAIPVAAALTLLVLLFFVTISSFPAAPIGLIERITAAAQALWPLAVVLSAAPRR